MRIGLRTEKRQFCIQFFFFSLFPTIINSQYQRKKENSEEKKNVLMISEAALIYDKERKASVEIPDAKADNGKKKLSVKLGISNGVKTEILEGLKEKQEVILQ